MKLGFVGLGVIGRPLAEHLLRAGHELGVWARRAESAQPLVAAGATAFPTPAALAAHAEIVFAAVTGSADVERLTLGPDGFIDAPVSGGGVALMARGMGRDDTASLLRLLEAR